MVPIGIDGIRNLEFFAKVMDIPNDLFFIAGRVLGIESEEVLEYVHTCLVFHSSSYW
jgi:hypothetical protein